MRHQNQQPVSNQQTNGGRGEERVRGADVGCPRNEKNKIRFEPKQTGTRSALVVFRIVLRKPKTKVFGWLQFVSVFPTYIRKFETNRTARNNQKQTSTTLNLLKKTKCDLYQIVCFGWSSVCFGSIEISKLSVSVQKQNN